MTSPVVREGTAGWSIPSRFQMLFASSGSHLERYAQQFSCVEINSSFYRHHRVDTYRRWANSVPTHFRFAVKVPKTLTHGGELVSSPGVLDRFAAEIDGLGEKLGVLLVQLPPTLAFRASAARHFFRGLQKRIAAPIACEPRHSSWGSQRVDDVLSECAVARVAADPPPWLGADEPGGHQQVAYFRWHGQPRKYYSEYNQEQLGSLWQRLAIAKTVAGELWVIFDNTAMGFAMGNALATINALKE